MREGTNIAVLFVRARVRRDGRLHKEAAMMVLDVPTVSFGEAMVITLALLGISYALPILAVLDHLRQRRLRREAGCRALGGCACRWCQQEARLEGDRAMWRASAARQAEEGLMRDLARP
jgi:hypothetical protein